jgi:hypothetical protein
MYSKNTQVHDTPRDLERSASNLAAGQLQMHTTNKNWFTNIYNVLTNWPGNVFLKGVVEEHGGSRAGVVTERCPISVEVKTNHSPPAIHIRVP